jgi:hypothetical protein
MSTSIDWTELIKDRKGVITKDNQACGNIIGEDDENIIIEDGAVRQHFYRVPKSAAGAYNGAELTLNISYDELKTYEEKEEGKGILESVTGTIKDKTKSVKEKLLTKLTMMTMMIMMMMIMKTKMRVKELWNQLKIKQDRLKKKLLTKLMMMMMSIKNM